MKTMRIISWVFPVVGGLMLLGASLLWVSTRNFVAGAQTLQGTVVELIANRDSDGDTTYKPVVRFSSPDGQEVTYTESFSGNPAPYDLGESVEVLYSPGHSRKARIKGFVSLWLGPVILAGIGLVFTAIGVGIFLARHGGRRKKDYLMAYGNAIQTDLQGVERNTSLEIGGKNPWRISSQYLDPATNKLRIFHSENLWFDPTRFVTAKQVTVLLDPKDPKRYHMDVSFLPELEAE
jgi:Protein of unknown function (DUF3592)